MDVDDGAAAAAACVSAVVSQAPAPAPAPTTERCRLSHSLHSCCCWLVSVLGPECTQLVSDDDEPSEALRSPSPSAATSPSASLFKLTRLALLE